MLEAMQAKHSKVLLFSYSVKLLDIIQSMAIEKNYSFVRLDGNTKNKERQLIVDNFNQDQSIFLFLISTKLVEFILEKCRDFSLICYK